MTSCYDEKLVPRQSLFLTIFLKYTAYSNESKDECMLSVFTGGGGGGRAGRPSFECYMRYDFKKKVTTGTENSLNMLCLKSLRFACSSNRL